MTQQINLLDPALLPTRDWCNGKFVLALALTLSVGTATHVAYEAHALTQILANATSAPQDAPATDPQATDTTLNELRARVSANENLLQAVGSFAELPRDNAARLRVLISAMPDRLWLQEVEFSVERGVRIAGNALDAKALAGFAKHLGAQPAFRGLPLHLFALHHGERDEAAAAHSTDGATSTTTPPHYGFLLSSIDSARASEGLR